MYKTLNQFVYLYAIIMKLYLLRNKYTKIILNEMIAVICADDTVVKKCVNEIIGYDLLYTNWLWSIMSYTRSDMRAW